MPKEFQSILLEFNNGVILDGIRIQMKGGELPKEVTFEVPEGIEFGFELTDRSLNRIPIFREVTQEEEDEEDETDREEE